MNPHTNEIVESPGNDSVAVQRLYFGTDLQKALREWGRLKEHHGASEDAQRIVEKVVAAEGSPIHEVFFLPGTKQYITVVLEKDLTKGSAFVNFGFVDFRCDLPGSVPAKDVAPDAEATLRRLYLPTGAPGGGGSTTKASPKPGVCPICQLQRAATGACGCG